MKLRELLKKLRRRPPQEGESTRADSINEAFNAASAELRSSYVPSQQDDRPRH
jgi:hypothetical protein